MPVPKGEIAAIPVNIVLPVVDASPAYLSVYNFIFIHPYHLRLFYAKSA
ncbi:hypothetical protein HMPREF0372_04328 [Flavonifractor plautii ATCC 29863]|uniref:Uncharacterized protein n=1 Tax=Flavonifractor plautii ATCC 29863 TaxID=411475 RepID=G9YXR0_FLAPL|nr:hypothetical protein HMPREF0372_04328 [Flavonifractor plautii ATCC 29863]